ncbi:MAG: hypothetical protein K6F99_11650 [Lachnospiraceae bacterium]|nr:hypothetical protein [Lachnospiraceae bacterium]
MTLEAYLNPDFTWPKRLIFLGEAFLGIVICVLLIVLFNRIATASKPDGKRQADFYERTHNRVQRFYEMMISAASVMSFACAYVIINHIYSMVQGGESAEGLETLVSLWENGRDFILLLLICISCLLNTLFDKLIIPLKNITKEEKATIRMLGMFYVILILLYLNVIGDESEYSPVMMYYLGLMVGRFVYFDASFSDFIDALKNCFKNLYLIIMGLALTGLLCFIGFKSGYLLERNYYIVGAFYTHIFIIAAIFILHHSHLLHLIAKKPKEFDDGELQEDPDTYEYGDYREDEEYDSYDEDYEEDGSYTEDDGYTYDEEYAGDGSYTDDEQDENGSGRDDIDSDFDYLQ